MKKFIIIEVDVDDKNESNCDQQCRFLSLSRCELFNIYLHENNNEYVRCINCLGSSF